MDAITLGRQHEPVLASKQLGNFIFRISKQSTQFNLIRAMGRPCSKPYRVEYFQGGFESPFFAGKRIQIEMERCRFHRNTKRRITFLRLAQYATVNVGLEFPTRQSVQLVGKCIK